jgi:nucleoside-diphosphate-sugar epimerase
MTHSMPAPLDGYRRVRAVVTGASGFIGRWVARLLSASQADLFLLVRDPARSSVIFTSYGIRGKIISMDLTCRRELEAAFRQIRPAVVFHLAGYGVDRGEREEQGFVRINVEAVEHVALAVAASHDGTWPGAQFVHAGSIAEYGPIGGDLAEGSTENPTLPYGRSKLEGTRRLAALCARTGLRGITARLATVYGPGEHPGRLLPTLLAAANGSDPIPLSEGFQKRDFTYVEDVAEGLLRLGAANTQPGDVVNLVTGKLSTVRDFVKIAASVLRIPAARLAFGALPVRKEEEAEYDSISNRKLLRLTGWVPSTPIEVAVRRTASFLADMSRNEGHA